MAKQRVINTRLWNDTWVSQIDPLAKLLFVYFLTNEHTNLSGIYELPLKVVAIETGLDATMIPKMMPMLDGRIYYHEGWVIIKNFIKHQNINSPKIVLGVKRELMAIPKDILNIAIGYGYPMDTLSHLNLNSNLNSNLPEGVTIEEENPKKDKTYFQVFDLFSSRKQGWMTHKPQIEAAKRLLEHPGLPQVKRAVEFYTEHKADKYCPQVRTPFELEEKWSALIAHQKRS